MTYDIVSIGSAVLDVLLRSSQFTQHQVGGEVMLCEISGGKVDVEEAALGSGGAGTNTAVGFARQGLQSAVVAEIGKDVPAQIIIDELTREHVSIDLLVEEPEERTGMSAVMVASDGSRSAMTFRGAAKMLSHKDVPFEVLQSVPFIHLSSIGNVDLIRELFLFCKQNNIKLSWNPSSNELKEVVFQATETFHQACNVIIMNEIEYEAVSSKHHLLEKLSKIVIVTRGREGGEVWVDGNRQTYTAHTTQAVSELGAGDAFASGFVGALVKNLPIDVAISWGVQNAASVVSQLGAKKGLLSFTTP